MLYVFKNRRNGKYITGTDYSVTPHHQIMKKDARPLIISDYDHINFGYLESEIRTRNINLKTYKVVKIKIVEIGELKYD